MNAPTNLPASPTDACRHDGWTQDRRRLLLQSLAEGHSVEGACARVGMSKVSAYALRRRDPGFALAWSAACLRARDALADTLMSRALGGQTDTWTRADGIVVSRHRQDNRLGLALLARLDRMAAQPNTSELGQPDEAAARGVAHDFDAFVDLVEEEGVEPEVIEQFVEPRIRKLRSLCSDHRLSGWHADGGKAVTPKPFTWCNTWKSYVTDRAPPPDFKGREVGVFGQPGYKRTLPTGEMVRHVIAYPDGTTKIVRRDGIVVPPAGGADAPPEAQP